MDQKKNQWQPKRSIAKSKQNSSELIVIIVNCGPIEKNPKKILSFLILLSIVMVISFVCMNHLRRQLLSIIKHHRWIFFFGQRFVIDSNILTIFFFGVSFLVIIYNLIIWSVWSVDSSYVPEKKERYVQYLSLVVHCFFSILFIILWSKIHWIPYNQKFKKIN